MGKPLSRSKKLICLIAIAGSASVATSSRSLLVARDPPAVPPVAYHTQHPKTWFSAQQCATCHPITGNKSPQLNRTHCETCHNLAMYPDHEPQYAQKPMACLWCHGRTEYLKDTLHQVAQHQICTTCHDDRHAGQLPVRAQCIACHQDRKNHIRDAPVCYGCHTFSTNPVAPDLVGQGAPVFAPEPTPSLLPL